MEEENTELVDEELMLDLELDDSDVCAICYEILVQPHKVWSEHNWNSFEKNNSHTSKWIKIKGHHSVLFYVANSSVSINLFFVELQWNLVITLIWVYQNNNNIT